LTQASSLISELTQEMNAQPFTFYPGHIFWPGWIVDEGYRCPGGWRKAEGTTHSQVNGILEKAH
jgi:hypothetical protein